MNVQDFASLLPARQLNYYGGAWHEPVKGGYFDTVDPATGDWLAKVPESCSADVDAAVAQAKQAFVTWRKVKPADRAGMLREVAEIIRKNAEELAFLDALNGGNPVRELRPDILNAAAQIDFFAGLVTEMKGHSVPAGPDAVNFSVREPRGVVARILPFNHPFMFCAGKMAAPLAAGNTVIIKPPEQAPLSALRLAELSHSILPDGVLNVLVGRKEVGAALAAHADVAMVGLIGSVAAGRSVMRAAAETIKPVLLELGGKNALIACSDADPEEVAAAATAGMNLGWCGQSCGSTSRAFIHADIYDAVVERLAARYAAVKPGSPVDPQTKMGAMVSHTQLDRVLAFIASAQEQGARLIAGGKRPLGDDFSKGSFIEPTVFADVRPGMRIADEEIFGPVLSVIKWNEEDLMLKEVNAVEYGLTCSIWTDDITLAHRFASEVEAGFVWINEVSKHFLGSPFGGYKQSGIGREECLEELMGFTQEKHIHVNIGKRLSNIYPS